MNRDKPFTLALLSDTHYYSPKLGIQGEAYRLRSGSDQKCLGESGDVLREAFRCIRDSDADAVLITGDLTNNGERCSHEEMRAMLRKLREAIPVYVLTATHDWCSDNWCARYSGERVILDVPTMPEAQLPDYYREFALDEATETFFTPWGGMSCVVPVRDGLRLLLLNDDRNGSGRAGYYEGHLQWIEAQLRKAAADGVRVIAAAHHPILPPIHPFFTSGSSIGAREAVAARLADAGLRCIVTGHLHMQQLLRYVSPAGNSLAEISLGALCGWPGHIVYATVTPSRITLRTEQMTRCADLVRRQSWGVLKNPLDASLQSFSAFRKRVDALGMRGITPLYRFLRTWAGRFDTWTLDEAYAALRKTVPGLPKLSLQEIGALPLGDTVEKVFLSIFGDGLALRETDELYALVMALFSLPAHFVPSASFARSLRESGDCLLRKEPMDGKTIDLE